MTLLSPIPGPCNDLQLQEGNTVKKGHPTSLLKRSQSRSPGELVDGVKKGHLTFLFKPSQSRSPGEVVDGVKKGHPTSLFQPSQSSPSPEERDVVNISSNPPKYDPNIWLPNLDLYIRDKGILQSSGWLNDAIIFAAQKLLEDQTKGNIFGWQLSFQREKACLLFFLIAALLFRFCMLANSIG